MGKIIKFPFFKDKKESAPDNLLVELVNLTKSGNNDSKIIKLLSSKSTKNNPVAIPYTPQAITKDLKVIRMYISQYAPSDSEIANLIAIQMLHRPIKGASNIVIEAGYSTIPADKVIFMGTFCTAQKTLMEFTDTEITRYTISTCCDKRVCEKCKKMDGKSFSVAKAVVGKNLPPFCDSCRCVILPKFK